MGGEGGWKICFEKPTHSPLTRWTISGNGCQTSHDASDCIESNNFPGNYGNSESCAIDLHQTLHMKVDSFQTNGPFDYLIVNGDPGYGKSLVSQNVVGVIAWVRSDDHIGQGGWKICFEDPQYPQWQHRGRR